MDHAVPFKALSLSLHPFVTCFSLLGCVHKAIDCYTPGQVSFSVNRNKMALSFHWIMFFFFSSKATPCHIINNKVCRDTM